jgi:hypothetical protein
MKYLGSKFHNLVLYTFGSYRLCKLGIFTSPKTSLKQVLLLK